MILQLTKEQFLIEGRQRATRRQYNDLPTLLVPYEDYHGNVKRYLSPEEIEARKHQAALDKLAKWNATIGGKAG